MATIVTDLKACNECAYNILNHTKRNCLVNRKTFFETISTKLEKEKDIIKSDADLPISCPHLNIADTRIMYLNFAAMVYRVLQILEADDIIKSDDPDTGTGLYLGYTPENWHRGFCTFKFALRESSDSRNAERPSKRAKSAAKNRPIEPEYLTAEDFLQMKIVDSEAQEAADGGVIGAIRDLEDALVDDDDYYGYPTNVTTEMLHHEKKQIRLQRKQIRLQKK
jgi:hypothetical protein